MFQQPNYEKIINNMQSPEEIKNMFPEMSVDELADVLSLTIKKDYVSKIICALGMILAFTEDSQINISFNAPSSTGKSHTPLEIAQLFPDDSLERIGSASPTSFFHRQDSYNKEKNETLVFLSRLSKSKGIEDAIKTFGILRTLGDYQFWVVGKSDRKYLKSLKAMVERNKVSVKFFGYVSHREKFALLSKAHLLINPSIREGWGLVNIEANVVGTPVVAYNSPGLIDSVKNGITGVICDENTPDSMAGEVTALLRDTQRYEKMRKNAIVWAKGFSWKKSMRESQMLVDRVGVKKV